MEQQQQQKNEDLIVQFKIYMFIWVKPTKPIYKYYFFFHDFFMCQHKLLFIQCKRLGKGRKKSNVDDDDGVYLSDSRFL